MTTPEAATAELTDRIERCYDALPRAAGARAEEVGPLTVFVVEGGPYPYYARPTLGAPDAFTVDHVTAVRERQRALGVTEAVEWQHATATTLAAAVRASGLAVAEHPLLVLPGAPEAPAAGAGVELVELTPDSPDELYATAAAVANTGFGHPGTAVGDAGADAFAAELARVRAAVVERQRDHVRSGFATKFVALVDGAPAAAASAQAAGGAAEIVGVATLPAYRRRGLAAVVTGAVVRSVLASGAGLVFLSADTEDVARIYGRLGFTPVGTAYTAEP